MEKLKTKIRFNQALLCAASVGVGVLYSDCIVLYKHTTKKEALEAANKYKLPTLRHADWLYNRDEKIIRLIQSVSKQAQQKTLYAVISNNKDGHRYEIKKYSFDAYFKNRSLLKVPTFCNYSAAQSLINQLLICSTINE
jgi:hypothetical protein